MLIAPAHRVNPKNGFRLELLFLSFAGTPLVCYHRQPT
jgi:hypothetical protein